MGEGVAEWLWFFTEAFVSGYLITAVYYFGFCYGCIAKDASRMAALKDPGDRVLTCIATAVVAALWPIIPSMSDAATKKKGETSQ